MRQANGITIFNYPEIRSELGLTEAEVAGLRATHEKLKKDVIQQYFDKKITQPEAAQIYETTLKNRVHDGVRAELGHLRVAGQWPRESLPALSRTHRTRVDDRHITVSEAAGQRRAGVEEDGGDVESRRGHQHSGQRLVTSGEKHGAV